VVVADGEVLVAAGVEGGVVGAVGIGDVGGGGAVGGGFSGFLAAPAAVSGDATAPMSASMTRMPTTAAARRFRRGTTNEVGRSVLGLGRASREGCNRVPRRPRVLASRGEPGFAFSWDVFIRCLRVCWSK
jgi:hypothetical protein